MNANIVAHCPRMIIESRLEALDLSFEVDDIYSHFVRLEKIQR